MLALFGIIASPFELEHFVGLSRYGLCLYALKAAHIVLGTEHNCLIDIPVTWSAIRDVSLVGHKNWIILYLLLLSTLRLMIQIDATIALNSRAKIAIF